MGTVSLCAAMAAGFGLLGTGGAASASIRPLTTGVSYVYDNQMLAFEHVRQTGAHLAMSPLRWGEVAPSSEPVNWQPSNPADPHYNWEFIDTWVTHAVQAGLVPILQVRGAPRWAQRCGGATEIDAPCKPDPAALAAFTTAAAQRYSGHFGGLPQVRFWQALDEPNLSLFFNPQFENGQPVSATLYRTLMNTFYAAVKQVDASNIVLAGGLGPIAVHGYTIGPMQFTRELLCMKGREHFHPTRGNCDGGVHFDIFDIHPYTTGGPTHKGGVNDVELGDLPKLQALLLAADEAGRIVGRSHQTPLWVTEFGWDSNPPDPGGLPMTIETRWTAEALFRAWKAGVSNFFWYSLRDFPPEPNRPFSETLQTGLYFRGNSIEEDQPKELMYAFRFPFVAYPHRHGLLFWGRTPSSTPGKIVIQIWKGNRWRHVGTMHADSHGMFMGVAPTHYGNNKRGYARAVYRGQAAVPFSMHPVPDFYQPPFG
jgi:hypothetical protein